MIKEEGKVVLVIVFYLENEGNNLNFNLIKEYLFHVKNRKYFTNLRKKMME